MTDFTLSQMIEGFLLSKTAQGLSVHTIANYRHFLDKFASFVGPDIAFSSITKDHITRFLAWLQTEYHTSRGQPLSAKTVSGNYAALSTFWTWAKGEGFTDHHLLKNIPTPKATPPVIDPLTKEQVKALLKACNSTRPWKERPGTVTRRPTASRDKALLLFFLDTGCRVSEVCDLTIGDVDKSRHESKCAAREAKSDSSTLVSALDSPSGNTWPPETIQILMLPFLRCREGVPSRAMSCIASSNASVSAQV